MFWRKKIKNPESGSLNIVEQNIINYIIQHLPDFYANILKQQILLLKRIRRLEYPNYQVTELYPQSFNSISNTLLFPRQEEFRIAVVKFSIRNISYKSEVFFVLGALFEVKIRPKIESGFTPEDITFIELMLEENLETNIIK